MLNMKDGYAVRTPVTTIVENGVTVSAKRCQGTCNRLKPLTDFAKDAKGVGGRKALCTKCRSERAKLLKSLK